MTELESFTGTETYTLDPKSRLALPKEYRDFMTRGGESKVTILRGFDSIPCLWVYPHGVFAEHLRRFRSTNTLIDDDALLFQDTLLEDVDHQLWDSNTGRVLIKKALMSYAGLQRDVVVTGAVEYFKLWSPEQWKARKGLLKLTREERAARLIELQKTGEDRTEMAKKFFGQTPAQA